MDNEYLKTREDVLLVRKALSVARDLEKAEQTVEKLAPEFRSASHEVTEQLGFILWHNQDDKNYYWQGLEGKNSVTYPNRSLALRALLDEEIQWED